MKDTPHLKMNEKCPKCNKKGLIYFSHFNARAYTIEPRCVCIHCNTIFDSHASQYFGLREIGVEEEEVKK